MSAIGVDYASVDGNAPPDWESAKNAGLSFVYVRQAEGTWIDPTAARDRDSAAAEGIAFGATFMPRWPRRGEPVPSPEFQIAAFAKAYGDRRPGELPPALDLEFPRGGRAATLLNAFEAIAMIERFHTLLVERYGQAIDYSSYRVWVEDLAWLPAPDLADAPLWIKTAYFWTERRPWDTKHFTPASKLPRPWADKTPLLIHQIQGDATGFPGFTSTVDVNLADEQTIAALRVLP